MPKQSRALFLPCRESMKIVNRLRWPKSGQTTSCCANSSQWARLISAALSLSANCGTRVEVFYKGACILLGGSASSRVLSSPASCSIRLGVKSKKLLEVTDACGGRISRTAQPILSRSKEVMSTLGAEISVDACRGRSGGDPVS
jgi:hypothetical protein